ncbi:MAG: hypothetical protein JW742_04220, partial [Candidatus Aminicenantes bacterium]|nr:hypothetical protein [Candidatus Aminicenantes bacterium]
MNVRRFRLNAAVLAALFAAALAVPVVAQDAPRPPLAEKIRKELTLHGQTRVDDYYWLNERSNPKVVEYLKA